jgi:hypothetical protein
MTLETEIFKVRYVNEHACEVVDQRNQNVVACGRVDNQQNQWTLSITFDEMVYVEILELAWMLSRLNARLKLMEDKSGQVRAYGIGCSG